MQIRSETAACKVPRTNKLATTYEGGDPRLLENVAPLVDYIEIVPDTIAIYKEGVPSINPEVLTELKNICRDIPIIAHGIGLSIGSHEGYSEEYLRLLDEMMDKIEIAWHSEHLGYTSVDGINLGTMLPMPLTQEVLEILGERIDEIKRRYNIPFLLENVAHVLPVFSKNYRAAQFLNSLVSQTGCHLLLDIYNLECDAINHGLDIEAFLSEINMDAIWEVHVANGIEHRNLRLDVHSELTQQSTLDLANKVLDQSSSVRVVTYELLSQAVPLLGYEAIVQELQRIRSTVLS